MKKIYLFLLVLPVIIVLQFCSPGKKTASSIPVVVSTFDADVKPLISEKCTPCHSMTGKKEHLVEYAKSVANIDSMIIRIKMNPDEKGYMPFKKEKLSDSLINVFVKWKADGLKEK